jgi:hypothetical protein
MEFWLLESDYAALVDIFYKLGTWAIFAWLYVQERRDHNATRAQHLQDLRDLIGFSDRLKPPASREE